jgi:hypothetical protein
MESELAFGLPKPGAKKQHGQTESRAQNKKFPLHL